MIVITVLILVLLLLLVITMGWRCYERFASVDRKCNRCAKLYAEYSKIPKYQPYLCSPYELSNLSPTISSLLYNKCKRSASMTPDEFNDYILFLDNYVLSRNFSEEQCNMC